MNNSRRILGRTAIGACGPLALTALSGVLTPAMAANPETVSCNTATYTAAGSLFADAPTHGGSFIFGDGGASCHTSSSSNQSVTVQLQVLKNGSWANIGSAATTQNSSGYIAGFPNWSPCAGTATYRTAAISSFGANLEYTVGRVSESRTFTC